MKSPDPQKLKDEKRKKRKKENRKSSRALRDMQVLFVRVRSDSSICNRLAPVAGSGGPINYPDHNKSPPPPPGNQ